MGLFKRTRQLLSEPLGFYFGGARCRLLVLEHAPSALPWWLQIKDTQRTTHSLHQRAHVCLHICWCQEAELMSDAGWGLLGAASS